MMKISRHTRGPKTRICTSPAHVGRLRAALGAVRYVATIEVLSEDAAPWGRAGGDGVIAVTVLFGKTLTRELQFGSVKRPRRVSADA